MGVQGSRDTTLIGCGLAHQQPNLISYNERGAAFLAIASSRAQWRTYVAAAGVREELPFLRKQVAQSCTADTYFFQTLMDFFHTQKHFSEGELKDGLLP